MVDDRLDDLIFALHVVDFIRKRIDEDHSEWQVCRFSDDLGVEKISQTDQGSGQGYQYHNPVDHLQVTLSRFFLAGVQPQRKQDYKSTPMAGQALQPGKAKRVELEGKEYTPWFRPDDLGLIKDNVAEAGTHDGGDNHIDSQGIDILIGFTFLPVDIVKDLLADKESQGKKQPVPAQRERSDGKDLRATVPNDKVKNGHKGKYMTVIYGIQLIAGI